MKQIIIFLLLVIVGIMGYNIYKKYQRFNPPNYQYKAADGQDANHPDKALLLNYQNAIATLDGYVITQWGTNGIDVRNPGDDDEVVLAAVAEYNEKLGNVKFYESQLLANEMIEEVAAPLTAEEEKKLLIYEMFATNPTANSLRLGERSAMVFEIQRLLIKKGDSIRHDGLFRTETFNALKAYEEKNGLFADGRLDAMTLQYLLK